MCGWRSGSRFGMGVGFWPNPSTAVPSSRLVTTPTIETDFGIIGIAASSREDSVAFWAQRNFVVSGWKSNFVAMTWAGSRGGGLPCSDRCRTPGLADATVNRRLSLARYHREIEKQRLYRQGGAFCFAVD